MDNFKLLLFELTDFLKFCLIMYIVHAITIFILFIISLAAELKKNNLFSLLNLFHALFS